MPIIDRVIERTQRINHRIAHFNQQIDHEQSINTPQEQEQIASNNTVVGNIAPERFNKYTTGKRVTELKPVTINTENHVHQKQLPKPKFSIPPMGLPISTQPPKQRKSTAVITNGPPPSE